MTSKDFAAPPEPFASWLQFFRDLNSWELALSSTYLTASELRELLRVFGWVPWGKGKPGKQRPKTNTGAVLFRGECQILANVIGCEHLTSDGGPVTPALDHVRRKVEREC